MRTKNPSAVTVVRPLLRRNHFCRSVLPHSFVKYYNYLVLCLVTQLCERFSPHLLYCFVESAHDDFHLLFTAQAVEVYGVAGDADGECRIVVRMLHGINEQISVHHVDI